MNLTNENFGSNEIILYNQEPLKMNKKPKVFYVLTNKRAMILNKKAKKNPLGSPPLEECNIFDTVAIVQNRKSETDNKLNDRKGFSIINSVGDVIFMESLHKKMSFIDIRNPDNLVKQIEELKKVPDGGNSNA